MRTLVLRRVISTVFVTLLGLLMMEYVSLWLGALLVILGVSWNLFIFYTLRRLEPPKETAEVRRLKRNTQLILAVSVPLLLLADILFPSEIAIISLIFIFAVGGSIILYLIRIRRQLRVGRQGEH